MTIKKKLVINIILGILYCTYPQDATNDVQLFRDTLQYGIEAEIVSTLKPLTIKLNDEAMKLLFERYKSASLQATKISILEYFVKLDTLDKNVIDELFEEASDEFANRQIKVQIFFVLAKHGSKKHYDYLLSQLNSDDNVTKNTASQALNRVSSSEVAPAILEKLIEADETTDYVLSTEIRNNLILSLGKMKYTHASRYLRKLVQDEASEAFTIMYAMHSLANIGDEKSIPLIVKQLSNEDKKIRTYAGYALSLMKSPLVIDSYKNMLVHNDADIRNYALQGLIHNEDCSLLTIVEYRFLKDPEQKVKNQALKTLVLLGDDGIKRLQEVMKKAKYNHSHLFVISEAVSEKPQIDNVEFLISLYKKADDKGKEIIAKNVVKSQDNHIDPIIELLLSSKDYLIRIGAINAILSIKNTTLAPTLKEMKTNEKTKAVQNALDRTLRIIETSNE